MGYLVGTSWSVREAQAPLQPLFIVLVQAALTVGRQKDTALEPNTLADLPDRDGQYSSARANLTSSLPRCYNVATLWPHVEGKARCLQRLAYVN